MAKRSFVLFHDYSEQFLCLSDAECGQLIKAIFIYETEGEVTALPPEARMAFRFIRHALDENRDKYEDICKKRSEAAKKSHLSRGNANASNCMQKQAFAADTDTDTVTETVTVTVTETETETVTETEFGTETNTAQDEGSVNKQENTPTPQKKAWGEFSNVYLTAEEMARLMLDYGVTTANEAVNLLSTRIARDNNSRYKNENHYATIKSWVITAVEEQKQRKNELSEKQKPKETNNCRVSALDGYDLEDFFETPCRNNKTPKL